MAAWPSQPRAYICACPHVGHLASCIGTLQQVAGLAARVLPQTTLVLKVRIVLCEQLASRHLHGACAGARLHCLRVDHRPHGVAPPTVAHCLQTCSTQL